MAYVCLALAVLAMASSNILAAFYNRASVGKSGAQALYNVIMQSANFLCWLIAFLVQGGASLAVVPYALLFSAFFVTCAVLGVYVLKAGPLLLSSLFLQMSLILTTIWGLLFWDEPFSVLIAVGLVLVVVSIYLCLREGEGKETEKRSITVLWLMLATIHCVTNAGASISQTTQQMKFDGVGGAFLMVIATGISTLVSVVMYLRTDRSTVPVLLRSLWYLPVAAGAGNMLLNLLVMYLATSTISKNLTYPTLAIGGLAITTVFSALIFREKLRWWQWTGVVLGAVAVGLLSI